ncbi:MAG: stage V sporulation protein AA [Defluviitaleaceae bacterium]|nr:stage V sporulation protein AA [Defluviitaleaceae bacterium]
MDIYIKPARKVAVSEAKFICVRHVAEVQAEPSLRERVESLKLQDTGKKNGVFLVSVMDIIKAIEESLPGHTVNNVGEMDTVVLYSAKEEKRVPFIKWLKIAVIGLVMAVGAATAIMSFHNDSEIPKIFRAYHKMFTGQEVADPRVIQVTYAIGIALGITVFFNHFNRKKIQKDPTPLEVEMSDYDNIVTETLVDFLEAKKSKKETGKK